MILIKVDTKFRKVYITYNFPSINYIQPKVVRQRKTDLQSYRGFCNFVLVFRNRKHVLWIFKPDRDNNNHETNKPHQKQ